jgi:hypothetical protein
MKLSQIPNLEKVKKMAVKVASAYLSAAYLFEKDEPSGDPGMAWVEYVKGPSKGKKVQICKNCRDGKHLSFGTSHLPPHFKENVEKLRNDPVALEEFFHERGNNIDCKNSGNLDGKHLQCMCYPSAIADGSLNLPF